MISVQLVGRLCNQLFQYACCIATALKYNEPYCIPKHTQNDKVWKPYSFENINYCESERMGTACVYKEKYHSFSEIPKPICRYYLLQGYFQSIRYFQEYLPQIRKAFGFECAVGHNRTVALHHRLGDYKDHPTKHVIISDDYIMKALSIMGYYGYKKCLVFSDEIDACKKIINSEKYPLWKFGYSVGRDELEDLQEMISCESFIISASTFSLMASILSESENKICIAPKKWFGVENAHLDEKDIVPENYIRI